MSKRVSKYSRKKYQKNLEIFKSNLKKKLNPYPNCPSPTRAIYTTSLYTGCPNSMPCPHCLGLLLTTTSPHGLEPLSHNLET